MNSKNAPFERARELRYQGVRMSKSTQKDSEERDKVIIRLTRAGLNLRQIGEVLGISRERVRQLRDRIVRKNGLVVFAGDSPVVFTLKGAASHVGISVSTLRRLLSQKGAPSSKIGRRVFVDLSQLGVFVERLKKPCIVCGTLFLPFGNQLVCSDPCREERNKITLSRPAEEKNLKGWRLILAGELKEHSLRQDEEWVTYKEAYRRAGISRMQLDYLRMSGFLAIRSHPTRRWHGRPVHVYAVSELEVVRRVYVEWS